MPTSEDPRCPPPRTHLHPCPAPLDRPADADRRGDRDRRVVRVAGELLAVPRGHGCCSRRARRRPARALLPRATSTTPLATATGRRGDELLPAPGRCAAPRLPPRRRLALLLPAPAAAAPLRRRPRAPGRPDAGELLPPPRARRRRRRSSPGCSSRWTATACSFRAELAATRPTCRRVDTAVVTVRPAATSPTARPRRPAPAAALPVRARHVGAGVHPTARARDRPRRRAGARRRLRPAPLPAGRRRHLAAAARAPAPPSGGRRSCGPSPPPASTRPPCT